MLSFIEYRFKRQGNRTAIFKSAKTYAAPASLNNRPVVLFPPEIYQVEPYFKSLITVGLTDDFCAWRVTLRYSFLLLKKRISQSLLPDQNPIKLHPLRSA